MASNRDLAARALALGRELGEEVETAGLNNAALVALVAELDAKVQAKGSQPEAETEAGPEVEVDIEVDTEELDAPAPPAAPPPAATPGSVVYRIAPGRAVGTFSRGVLGPGEEIQPKDLPGKGGGLPRIQELVGKGIIVERSK